VIIDCSGDNVNIEFAYFISPGEKLYINSNDIKEITQAVNNPKNTKFYYTM